MKRDHSLDFIKFSLVLLVILGHLIQYTYIKFGLDFDNSLIFRFIYSFHMPLFMFISGCLFVNVKSLKILQKVQLLIIPFFSWAIIDYFFFDRGSNFSVYIKNVIYQPDLGLWFLWVLFFIMVSTYILRIYLSDLLVFIVTGLIVLFVYFVSIFFKFKGFGVGLYAWQILYFVIGMYFYKYKHQFLKLNYFILFPILIIVYVFSMIFWERNISQVNIFDISFLNQAVGLVVKYLAALSFIFIIVLNWNVFSNLLNNRICLFFSENSLAFYAVQFPIINYVLMGKFSENIYVYMIICFVITVILSTVSIFILNKIKYIRIPLFGR